MPPEIQPGLDRRALIRRMAVGGAVVWASPMMHSVASAQATASCGTGLLNWDTFATGTVFTNTIIGNTTITMTITGVTNTTLLPNNGRVLDSQAGGQNPFQKHLRFEMTPTNGSSVNGSRQTITFTFSNPVSNVAFTFFDLDTQDNSWGDRLVMNTGGYTSSVPVGSLVIGNGTDGNRFRSSNGNANPTGNSNAGNVTVRYAGPITNFSFIYRNEGESGGSNQLISMSDISFTC